MAPKGIPGRSDTDAAQQTSRLFSAGAESAKRNPRQTRYRCSTADIEIISCGSSKRRKESQAEATPIQHSRHQDYFLRELKAPKGIPGRSDTDTAQQTSRLFSAGAQSAERNPRQKRYRCSTADIEIIFRGSSKRRKESQADAIPMQHSRHRDYFLRELKAPKGIPGRRDTDAAQQTSRLFPARAQSAERNPRQKRHRYSTADIEIIFRGR